MIKTLSMIIHLQQGLSVMQLPPKIGQQNYVGLVCIQNVSVSSGNTWRTCVRGFMDILSLEKERRSR